MQDRHVLFVKKIETECIVEEAQRFQVNVSYFSRVTKYLILTFVVNGLVCFLFIYACVCVCVVIAHNLMLSRR